MRNPQEGSIQENQQMRYRHDRSRCAGYA